MDDLISRQAAIDEIKEFKNACKEWRDEQKQEEEKEDEERSIIWHRADSAIVSALEIGLRIKKRIPSVDAVPVIHCNECKHMEEHYDTDGNVPYWFCKNWYGGTDSDGYCHEAERKEDGQDG